MKFIKRYKILLLILMIPLLIFGSFNQYSEYVIKGIFIEKFSRFITWTDETDKYFYITILNNSPFAKKLEMIYSNKKIKNKKVKIKYITNYREIKNPHVLFVSASNGRNLNEIILFLRRKRCLLISDTPGFAKRGTHINFYFKGKNLSFEINHSKIKSSGIKISYHLLRLGKIVGGIK